MQFLIKFEDQSGTLQVIGCSAHTCDNCVVSPPPMPQVAGDQLIIDSATIPGSFNEFANNFEKYEVIGTTVQLKAGESIGDRVIDPGSIDQTYPQTLKRANTTTSFQVL